ncbi:right-handed parallel beta-helix repeat-containing protein [Occultella gossypii]|uniref:Right-handed parallel beta-helix repeat-containing protein n=1 Tax=Occultella gossypii TaxID=2800820 RepID=A0ABS7SGQ7_9MICO|nr:right-handed parallel beta-helix repeat-containing protein [Occultella gossypii]MBZ2199387.1 right-handed parallel beta-helix repeat-containing protein [Occultella gossypii]
MRFRSSLALVSAAVIALTTGAVAHAAAPPPMAQAETALYLSPTGSDTNDGSVDAPLLTLTRAAALLAGIDTESATVWIEPGTYYEPAVVSWSRVPQSTVSLLSTGADRPTFDGSRATGNLHYWLNTARGPSLVVEGLRVINYRTGGIRMDTDGNVVRDMVFEQLGNAHVPDGAGYAALHLLGSSGNEISDTTFRDLENVACPGCMHGVYAANGSSDNVVTGSDFDRITGDPVRLRNNTHRNVFSDNTFSESGDFLGGGNRWPHRAMASFWRFTANEVCGTDNVLVGNVSDGRQYTGEPGQKLFGSGAEAGVERCPTAVLGHGNTVDPAL